MKDVNLILWLTQLGFSVAAPLAAFVLLAVWLRNTFDWGDWVIWIGVILGVFAAVSGFRASLRILGRISEGKKEDEPPAISFHDHE